MNDDRNGKTFGYTEIAIIIVTIALVAIAAALVFSKPWPPEPHPATLSLAHLGPNVAHYAPHALVPAPTGENS